jgi:hypothetical protein
MKKTFRVIIHAELASATEETVMWLRRWPGIELVHHFKDENALLIFVATSNLLECDVLIERLSSLNSIVQLKPHYLFPRVNTFTIPNYQPQA